MPVDIRKYAAHATATIPLLDGQGIPLRDENNVQATVTLYGPGSKDFAAAQARSQNRSIDRLKAKGRADQSAEEKERETAEYLASITERFDGIAYDDKTGRELVNAIYGDSSLGFIAKQVHEAAGDWAVFTKPSSSN